MITIIQSHVSEEVSACDLVPTLTGMDIEVPAGSVRFDRTDYVLEDSESFSVSAGHDIGGWLVETPEKEIHLLVYTWPHDRSGVAFDPTNYPTLKFHHMLFVVNVPAGTTDLNDLEMKLFHLVKPLTKRSREGE